MNMNEKHIGKGFYQSFYIKKYAKIIEFHLY